MKNKKIKVIKKEQTRDLFLVKVIQHQTSRRNQKKSMVITIQIPAKILIILHKIQQNRIKIKLIIKQLILLLKKTIIQEVLQKLKEIITKDLEQK
jgi:hypothetical protein